MREVGAQAKQKAHARDNVGILSVGRSEHFEHDRFAGVGVRALVAFGVLPRPEQAMNGIALADEREDRARRSATVLALTGRLRAHGVAYHARPLAAGCGSALLDPHSVWIERGPMGEDKDSDATLPEVNALAARSALRLRRLSVEHERLLVEVLAGHRDLALAWSLRLTRAALQELEASFREAMGRSVYEVALELHASRARG